MAPKHNPETVGLILKKILANLDKKQKGEIGEISRLWRQVVGKRAAGHSRPARFREGRLYINVDSSTWLYKLNLSYKKKALQRLRKALGDEKIEGIWFRIGEV